MAGSRKISILGRRQAPLEQTAKDLEKEFPGLRVLTYIADVSNKAQVDACFDSVAKEFGPIDVLINNAGYVTAAATVNELDIDDAWTAFETHTKGSMIVAQAFGRTARKSEAFVVETSSIVAILPAFPGSAAYTASKLAATKIWAFFGAENPAIRVVSIQPGQIETDMARKIGVKGRDDGKLGMARHVEVTGD